MLAPARVWPGVATPLLFRSNFQISIIGIKNAIFKSKTQNPLPPTMHEQSMNHMSMKKGRPKNASTVQTHFGQYYAGLISCNGVTCIGEEANKY